MDTTVLQSHSINFVTVGSISTTVRSVKDGRKLNLKNVLIVVNCIIDEGWDNIVYFVLVLPKKKVGDVGVLMMCYYENVKIMPRLKKKKLEWKSKRKTMMMMMMMTMISIV
jgi:hypothetical protein